SSSRSSAGAGSAAWGEIWGGTGKVKSDSALALRHDSATAPISAAILTDLYITPSLVSLPPVFGPENGREAQKVPRGRPGLLYLGGRNDLANLVLDRLSRVSACASRPPPRARCQSRRNRA